jgi:ABC-type branched-subunit amino acid transport system substrate-binding protein
MVGFAVSRRLLIAAALTTIAVSLALPASARRAAAADRACGKPTTASSSQKASTIGVTRSSIAVGNISIVSGPVPGLFQGAPFGVDAYFAYLNSKGGVNGRKIVLHAYDDGFSGTQNQALLSQSMSRNFADVGSFSLFDNYSCPLLAADTAFANVSATLDTATNALPNTFSPGAVTPGGPLSTYAYLKAMHPKEVTKSAALISNVDTAVQQWEGQRAAMEHAGFKFVYTRKISPLETSYTADILAMKAKGVQLIWIIGTGDIFAAFEKESAAQGFHPKLRISNGPAYQDGFVAKAGGAKVADGTILAQGLSLYLGEDARRIPEVKTFDTWMATTHPGFSPDLYSVYGWTSGIMFADALRAAGRNPTRGKVLAALQRTTSFDGNGLLAPVNPAKKLPANCVLFAQVVNGKWKRVSPTTSKTWSCALPFWSPGRGALPKVSPPR